MRNYLYERIELDRSHRVLDVGCGSGVLLAELLDLPLQSVVGLDIDLNYLALASVNAPTANVVAGDGHLLPIPEETFDVTLCHFLLLWVEDPYQVVSEMARVTKPGGVVLALAEPDYGGRIDHPKQLTRMGKIQSDALASQGADIIIGRKLSSIFIHAHLIDVLTGVIGGEWGGTFSPFEFESEWRTFMADLEHYPGDRLSPSETDRLYQLDRLSREKGERILYVPTFFALGKKRV